MRGANTGLGAALHLVVQDFRTQPGRTLFGACAAAAALTLLLLFAGLRQGVQTQLYEFAASLPADLVVAEAGTENFAGSMSSLPQSHRSAIEAVPGVRATHPLTMVPIIVNNGPRQYPLLLIAYESAGGPARLLTGHAPDQGREVVMDQGVARALKLAPGDRFGVMGLEVTISGLSDSGSPVFPYGYITYNTLLDIFLEGGLSVSIQQAPLLSMLLVDAQPGADLETLRRKLQQQFTDTVAFRPETLGRNDAAFGLTLYGPVLTLLTVVAWVVGVLALGLISFSTVVSRQREYTIQRALGMPLRGLVVELALQALLIAALGILPGVLGAFVLGKLVARETVMFVPDLTVATVHVFGITALLLAAMIGALLPLRGLLRIEPAMVFRT